MRLREPPVPIARLNVRLLPAGDLDALRHLSATILTGDLHLRLGEECRGGSLTSEPPMKTVVLEKSAQFVTMPKGQYVQADPPMEKCSPQALMGWPSREGMVLMAVRVYGVVMGGCWDKTPFVQLWEEGSVMLVGVVVTGFGSGDGGIHTRRLRAGSKPCRI